MKANNPFTFRITNQDAGEAEILIYGTIGDPGFFSMGEDSITALSFKKQLSKLGDVKNITVRINSGGGSVFDAQAIYNALNQHPAKVATVIDGIAASAASWIAMAGDEIRMAENGLFMYHLSQGFTMGDRWEHQKAIEIFDKIDKIISETYAKRTGKNAAELLAQMKDETWLTAQEALDAGFVTSIIESKGQPTACVGPECARLYNRVPDKAKLFFKGGAIMSAANGCKCGGKGAANDVSNASAEYDEGYAAAQAGAAETDNPYDPGTQENADWAQGFADGMAAATPAPGNAGPAYEEGCQVAMSQGSASDNPYDPGSPEWDQWQSGYDSCGAGNDAGNGAGYAALMTAAIDAAVTDQRTRDSIVQEMADIAMMDVADVEALIAEGGACPLPDAMDAFAMVDGIPTADEQRAAAEADGCTYDAVPPAGGDATNMVCPFCEGDGMCTECGGDGTMANGSTCPECNGSGLCIVCGGTGQVDNEIKTKWTGKIKKADQVNQKNKLDGLARRVEKIAAELKELQAK